MSKEERLDELAEQVVQTGNHLAGDTLYEFDRVREQLDTADGRESLTAELATHIVGFAIEKVQWSIAMYYDDDNEALAKGNKLIKDIQALDNDREME